MIHLLESHRFPMTPTRIVHIDTAASPTAVDGIASNLWLLCTEQARRGLDVTLFSRLDADPELAQAEAAAGFRIIHTPHAPKATNIRAARAALDLVEPDLVHFHGSWQPHHGIMGRLVRRAGIPYVYAPYGGLSPVVLASRRRLRRIYMAAFEIPLARGAAGWAPSFETEIDELRAVAGPHWQGAQRVLSPPVPHDILDSGPSETDPDPRRVVFLGRYDIFQKGLDRLVGLAAELPEITFQLHGSVDSASAADVDSLRARAPGNVIFGDPVFGADKARALASAGAYIQLSRFEGFPTSVAEALCSGLPAIVSDDLGVAAEITGANAGLALPEDPAAAARSMRAFLTRPDVVSEAGRNAASFGRETFSVTAIVDRQIDLYAEMLEGELRFGPPSAGSSSANVPGTATA